MEPYFVYLHFPNLIIRTQYSIKSNCQNPYWLSHPTIKTHVSYPRPVPSVALLSLGGASRGYTRGPSHTISLCLYGRPLRQGLVTADVGRTYIVCAYTPQVNDKDVPEVLTIYSGVCCVLGSLWRLFCASVSSYYCPRMFLLDF